MMAVFLDEPELVTSAQMDAWCRDFDSWAIVDTACFHLFDRTPHAWAKKKAELQKRAAFALLASLVAHDKTASDAQFIEGLALIEVAADDERNFVSKGVNWALSCVGRRKAKLKKAAMGVAMRLAAKEEKAPRWVGKDALREFRRSS